MKQDKKKQKRFELQNAATAEIEEISNTLNG
jgi:hypothetical protein